MASAASFSAFPGEQDVAVGAGELLLVEARAGDRVRVTGASVPDDLEIGVGMGGVAAGGPAAITWLPSEVVPGGRTFLVPYWTSSTTVVVRPRVAARLRASVAEPEVALLAWERFEEDAVEWVRGARSAPPSAPSGAIEPSLRLVAAMREALGGRAGSEAGRAWLSLALVHEGLLERPLTSLVFPRASAAVTGGRDVATARGGPLEAIDPTVWRAASSGEAIEVAAPDADVVRLRLLGGAAPARVVISAAGVPIRTIQLASAALRAPVAVPVRVLVPEGGSVRVRVESGEARIGVLAHRHRPGLVERLIDHHRDPVALAAAASADRVLGTLASAARARDGASFRRLEVAAGEAGDAGTKAVLLTLATCLAPSAAQAVSAARDGFRAAGGLPPAVAAPLRRRMAEALLDRRPEILAAFPDGPGLAAPAAVRGANEDDLVALRVALAVLDRKGGPSRPEAAALATRAALRDTGRDDWAARARLAWQAEVGWLPLAVVGAPDVRVEWAAPVPDPGTSSALCGTGGASGQRWTRLVPGTRELPAVTPAGMTHAVVQVRAETHQPLGPGGLRIDGVAVPVHASIGATSIVAVAAGAHTWTLAPGGGPLLVRLPREADAPCDELRRMERWFLATGEVSVDVPPGRVETVARVTVRRAGEGSAEGPLRLDVGGVSSEVRWRGADGVATEVPVRTTAGALRITPSAPVWMRVEVRGRAERGPVLPPALPTAPDEATLLAAVRAATRALAAATDEAGRKAARRARAEALAGLGFRRLASLDVEPAAEARPGEGPLALEVDPAGDVLARRLPAGAPGVVLLNAAAQIAELPPPSDPVALAPVVERLEGGDAAGAAARMAGVPEPTRPDEGTLLRALVTERALVWEPASRAYGRLALEADQPVAAARAALAYADLAIAKASPDTALIGYLFAKRAERGGADARAAMGRLEPAVQFVRPDTAAAAGHAWVEREGENARGAASLVARVRRAYLDAPDDAMVLEGDEQLVLRVAPATSTRLVVEHVCALLEPAPPSGASCSVDVAIDGRARACEGPRGACAVEVPAGKHRVDVALAAPIERMGWVRARWGKLGPVQPRSAARWLEADAARPVTLDFAGPTLVRIEARGRADEAGHMEVRVDGATATTLELDAPADPSAVRRDVADGAERAVRGEQMVEVIVAEAGAHRLEIRSRGRVLVRPSFAVARGLPRAPSVPRPLPGRSVFGDPIEPPPPPAPVVGEDAVPGPFTLSAQASLVLGRAQDFELAADNAGRYLELAVTARRRFLDGLLFARAGVLARARTGLGTFGANGRLDFNSPVGTAVPRVFLEGMVHAQEGPALDVAGRLRAGAWWQIEPIPGVNLVPTFGVDLSGAPVAEVTRYEDLARLDPDVYVRYDAAYPVTLFGTFLASYRPTMDAIVRMRGGVRTLGVEGMRDLFVYPSIDVSPGRGITPALTLGYTFGYHFASVSISEPYVSHRVDLTAYFWRWVQASHRVSASATAMVQAGTPFGDDPDLSLVFGLSYDFTAGRGMSDFGPLEVQFRERFDEGSGRVLRRTPQTGEAPPEPAAAP